MHNTAYSHHYTGLWPRTLVLQNSTAEKNPHRLMSLVHNHHHNGGPVLTVMLV